MNNRHRKTLGEVQCEQASLSVNRRGFLVGSAATIAGLAGLGGNAFGLTSAVTSPSGEYSISVGYWVGSDQIVVSGSAAPTSASDLIIPVSTVPANMSLLTSRGATVRVHGLFGAAVASATQGLDVTAQYAVNPSAGSVPVYVWSHRTSPTPLSSPSAMFAMPMNPGKGISLTLDCVTSTETAGVQAGATTLGALTATATGVYFIAVNTSSATQWSSVVFTTNPATGGARTLLQRTLSGMQSVSFPYLMVSIAPLGIKTPLSY